MSTSVDGDDMPMLYQCEKCAKAFGRPEEQYACERKHAQKEKAEQSAAEYFLLQQTSGNKALPVWRTAENSLIAEVNTLSWL